jgi:hypothetical protein
MTTEPTPYDDIAEALRLAFPQGTALLRLENGIEMLNHGARQFAANPRLAVEALGPRGATKFAKALLALGQQHVAVAERMLDLADEKVRRGSENDA